jgi:hypothetical protein
MSVSFFIIIDLIIKVPNGSLNLFLIFTSSPLLYLLMLLFQVLRVPDLIVSFLVGISMFVLSYLIFQVSSTTDLINDVIVYLKIVVLAALIDHVSTLLFVVRDLSI